MNFDANSLMLSIFFGLVGSAMLLYSKRAGVVIPACAGLLLMIVPFFFENAINLLLVCSIITLIPFFVRDI